MIKLYRGDAITVLRRLPDCSVQCCITSPPYWGLRDYGTATWQNGDAECEHKNGRDAPAASTVTGGIPHMGSEGIQRDICGKCGACRIDRQLGLEPTPSEYVARMVEVFAEVRRVLRPDGTLWLNIGDSYAASGPPGGQGKQRSNVGSEGVTLRLAPPGLKPKDLCGIPWRLAFALQADGWCLRSDIIWHKPNPMPESVRDRPTKSHEYVFLLSKSARYFWDQEAVREGYADDRNGASNARSHRYLEATGKRTKSTTLAIGSGKSGRNLRSVWTIPPRAFHGAHFATFPPAMVERCVKAGTSERGACPQCGKAWERVTEPTPECQRFTNEEKERRGAMRSNGLDTLGLSRGKANRSISRAVSTLGFR